MDEVDLGAAVGLVFFHVVFEELVEGFLGLAGEMADLLKQGLEEEGHSVVVSGRGPDALAIAQHHAFARGVIGRKSMRRVGPGADRCFGSISGIGRTPAGIFSQGSGRTWRGHL